MRGAATWLSAASPAFSSAGWRHWLCPSQDLAVGLQDVSPHCAAAHSFRRCPLISTCRCLLPLQMRTLCIPAKSGWTSAWVRAMWLLCCCQACCAPGATASEVLPADVHSTEVLLPLRCLPPNCLWPTHPPTHSAGCRPLGAAARCQGARLPRRLPERQHCQGPRRSGACCGLLPRTGVELRSAGWLQGVRYTPGLVAWSIKGWAGAPSTARLRMLPVACCGVEVHCPLTCLLHHLPLPHCSHRWR